MKENKKQNESSIYSLVKINDITVWIEFFIIHLKTKMEKIIKLWLFFL